MKRALNKNKNVEISVVAPCYNEAKGLHEFVTRTHEVLKKLKTTYELILINDGSRDESLDVAVKLTKLFPNLKVVNLSRNFGHQVAVTAGMDIAV